MKKRHRKTMRGTVLFTTVSVMALLIIFLMGTLVLASASNSRAHKSYSTAQATYTARAAIDNFVEAMRREGAIAAAVQEVAQPGTSGDTTKLVTVNLADKSIGKIGHIDPATGDFVEGSILIQNIGGGEYEYINEKGESVISDGSAVTDAKWVALDKVKITATAKVGQEYETVSAYVRKRAGSTTPVHGGGSAPTVKGIQMVGSSVLPSGDNITGGLGVNLADNSDTALVGMRNNLTIDTTLSFINSSLAVKTSTFQIHVTEPHAIGDREVDIPYSQTVIKGNLVLPNNKFVTVDYDMPKNYEDGDWNNQQVPYAFIDGCLVGESGITVEQTSGKSSPFNLFTGTFVTNANEVSLASTNLYMMDEYEPTESYTVYTVKNEQLSADDPTNQEVVRNKRNGATDNFIKGDNYLGYSGGSKLSKWTKSIATGTSSTADVGGSVFCNGRLTIKDTNVAGDVFVEGECVIEGNVTIGGQLKCGKLTKNGNLTCTNVSEGAASTTSASTGSYQAVNNEPASTINTAALVEIDSKSSLYKLNYIKWVPMDHKPVDSTNCPYGVDMWGKAVEQNEEVIYYRWTNEALVTDQMYNDTNVFAVAKSYDDLQNDPAYDAIRKNIADIRYSTNPPNGDYQLVKHSDGGELYYYGVPSVKDGKLIPSGAEADETEKYYNDPTTNAVYSQTYINSVPDLTDHYFRKALDGTITGEDIGNYPVTYYINNDPSTYVYDEEQAKAMIASSATPKETHIYPENMTREKIYGEYDPSYESGFKPADEKTKIVTTLQEARAALGLEADGTINEKAYPKMFDGTEEGVSDLTKLPTALKDGKVEDASCFGGTASNGNAAINQSCIIEGGLVEQKDKEVYAGSRLAIGKSAKVNGSPCDFATLYINPAGNPNKTDKIYIVLKDMKNSVESPAIVVEGDGTTQVYFVVEGQLTSKDKMMIIPAEFHEGVEFDYTKDWGITYYGKENSSIKLNNDSLLVGCFKMPYTDFYGEVYGLMGVKYTGEDGNVRTGKPTIVGNALFRTVSATNKFINYYTSSGGSSTGGGGGSGAGTSVKTEVGYFDIMYMLGN